MAGEAKAVVHGLALPLEFVKEFPDNVPLASELLEDLLWSPCSNWELRTSLFPEICFYGTAQEPVTSCTSAQKCYQRQWRSE